MTKKARPVGKTGPIRIGPGGIERRYMSSRVQRSISKPLSRDSSALEMRECDRRSRGKGLFAQLEQQPEDRPDLTVLTDRGKKWLELAEFAPLDQFGHTYGNVPVSWDASKMPAGLRSLVEKKAAKGYGADVILVIYKTHEPLFVPPPILRALRSDLGSTSVPFEAIYFLSPHDYESASCTNWRA